MHEYLKGLGIPVVDPDTTTFIATLLPGSVPVTELEAKQMRSLVEYICEGPAWCSSAEKMEIVTNDGTFIGGHLANTVTFWKKADGEWYYKKITWTDVLAYYPPRKLQMKLTLLELLDNLEGSSKRWAEWRAARPEIFPDHEKPVVLLLLSPEDSALSDYKRALDGFDVLVTRGRNKLLEKIQVADAIVLGSSGPSGWNLAEYLDDVSGFFTGPIITLVDEDGLPYVSQSRCVVVRDLALLKAEVRDRLDQDK